MSYTAIHHRPGKSNKTVAEAPELHDCCFIAAAYIDTLKHSETDLVVTIWRGNALQAVVNDDADGLRACTLKPYRQFP